MPGKILGIDVSEKSISAVQVISGLKVYEVLSCFSTPVSENNIGKALEELIEGFDIKSDRCILTIPAANTSFRNINTPFKDSKKIRQTLPFEIETLVPFSVDEKIIDYIHTDENDHASVLTSIIDKESIGNYIEQLKAAGIEPDIIDLRPVPAVTWLLDQETTPESGIYLDLEPEHPCVVIFQNKRIVLIRELPYSFSKKAEAAVPGENKSSVSEPIENIINTICREADRTVYSYYSRTKESFSIERVFYGGRLSVHSSVSDILYIFFKKPIERINISKDSRLKMDAGISGIYKPALMDNALAAAFRENKKSIGFNFRRGEFAAKRRFFMPGKDIRPTAILAGIFVFLMFLNTGIDYYYLNKKHTMLENRFNDKFDKTLPEERGVKDIRQRFSTVERKLQELENPSNKFSGSVKPDQKMLDILKEISQRVDERYDFEIDTISINNKEVSIIANTDSIETVSNIAQSLKGSNLFTKVAPGRFEPKNDRIRFPLKLDRAD